MPDPGDWPEDVEDDVGDAIEEQIEEKSHRGAFGDYGGASSGLIERTFRERIVLVGVTRDGGDTSDTDASLDELALLVDTAGADAVERVHQNRISPDPATFVGSGKAKEIKEIAEAVDCDTVVFDDELTPAQQYNLEKILGRSALDRTAVILDIFAQNASTLEGKAQVELAQLRYRLPRSRAAVSVPGDRARPNSRWIVDDSCGVSTSSRPTSARSRPTARPSRRRGPAPAIGRWRWSGTPTRASPRC